MRQYNMFKIFLSAVGWLMFSGLIGWLTWDSLGVSLFFCGVIVGLFKDEWFLK